MTDDRPLAGRRLQVAGSIGSTTGVDLAAYAHDLVRRVVRRGIRAGAGVVAGAGKEPAVEGRPAQVFDWSILEVVIDAIRSGFCPEGVGNRLPVVVVVSEKGEAEIPDPRKELWSELLESGRVEVKRIMAGSRSATMIREQQARDGDVLCVLGGGTGVEHLAEEYRKSCKAVIPVDLVLGSSREDGTGGAERLARESRANPLGFIRLSEGATGTEGAKLARIATGQGRASARGVATGVLDIIAGLAAPTAFYVRLLNPKHEAYERVDRFFRAVVDPVVEERGLARVDLGTDRTESGFLNVEVFRRLQQSSVTIVDVTGERPNCFIELGYALGREHRVLCTAEEGTNLPFDQMAIPCYFWKSDHEDEEGRRGLRAFWSQYIGRGAVVP